jgi:hypothetical protein
MTRLLLTLGTFAFAAVVYGLMLMGWRSRQRRQVELPEPPEAQGISPQVARIDHGLFVGTTGAEDWLDRIAVHGLSDRSTAALEAREDGVHLVREAGLELFIPWGSINGVSVETSLAGKVVSTGMLLVAWQLGPRALVSAYRADDPADHERLRAVIETRREAA